MLCDGTKGGLMMFAVWRNDHAPSIGFSAWPLLALLLTGCPQGGDSGTPSTAAVAAPTLTALSLSAGLLNPSFDPTVTTYSTMYIGNTSVTITPTAAAGATITVNGTTVTSGNASGAINLPTGNTTITVALTNSGSTTTYTITAHRLAQEAYVKASNTASDDVFGYSVALSGDTLAVGAISEDSAAIGINGNQADNSASGSGAVYVFTRSGTTWTQQAYIKASNTEAFDRFGASVALSGDTLAVGATQEASNATGINGNQTDNSANLSGAVYIFTRSGTIWTQQAYVKASNTEAGDHFGRSVALSGDTLAVGAAEESSNATGINGNQTDNSANLSGAVYIFTRSGTIWTQQAYVKASNSEANDQFGRSIALSGDTLAVGALNEDSAATGINGNEANGAFDSGAVYVFTRSGTIWTQQAYVKASNTGAVDRFGSSVALAGDMLAVGARGEASNATGINGDQTDDSANQSGAVYIFTRTGTTWSQQAYLKASNTGAGDHFGADVALEGETLLVGAAYDEFDPADRGTEDGSGTGVNPADDNGVSNSGAVYVFTRNGTTWTQQAYVKASNTGAGDLFGHRVAISGETMAVGAKWESSNATGINGNQADNSASSSGAAYVLR